MIFAEFPHGVSDSRIINDINTNTIDINGITTVAIDVSDRSQGLHV